MFDKAIANTQETIAICDEGLASVNYDADKRALVVQIRREALARLKGLLAQKAIDAEEARAAIREKAAR